MIYICPEYHTMFSGDHLFDELMSIEGKVYRDQNGRRTLQFSRNKKSFFIKIHTGVGWREIFKNLVQFRAPVLGAGNEWRAIRRLDELGIDTMKLVAYGSRGINPAQLQSFVITEDLGDAESLEDFCRDWPTSPPPVTLKRLLLNKVALTARQLHENGINHRDLYICHFLLKVTERARWQESSMDPDMLKLYLIDLHRVQCRDQTPRRWKIKDVAGLYFSSMDIGLTRRDLFRFMKIYGNKSLRQTMHDDAAFWNGVNDRATRWYVSAFERQPAIVLPKA